MPIYTNDPLDDGLFPVEPSLRSSIGIGPKVTKAIDAATKDWLDKHPEATTTVEDNSLTNAKFMNGSVNSRVIENESITTDDIADLAVTTPKIANNAVTTPKIANNAVTADKVASSAVDSLRIMSTTQLGVAKVGAGLAMNGQALELDGNGDIATAVTAWLNAHPEATTTVQDNSLNGATKLIDDSVPDSKLVQSGGVLEEVSDLKSAFESITEESEDYTNVTPLSTVTGKYVFNNTYNNKLNEASDASMAYKVFAVSPGNYKIYGFGYDRYQFYMAVIGDNSEIMDGSTPISNFIQNIECGGAEYPGDFTYHSVEITLNVTGYLFVNYKNAQAEGTCGVAKIVPIIDPAIKTSIANVKDSSRLHGLVKDGSDYYHFLQNGDNYIIRKFKQMGANNLFQWAGIYFGNVNSYGVEITSTVINYDTDIIGPITVFNTTLWPGQYGEWSGGNHAKTINGVAYPTAKQEELKVYVNGSLITDDGVYYGDVRFLTENSLYFPQSITGADLTTATKAITELREYNIKEHIKVRVRLRFVSETRTTLYYGMQAVIVPYNDILFANNEYFGSLPNSTNIDFPKKEHEVIMTASSGLRLISRLEDIGLGTFAHNDGSTGYATLPAASNTRKLYYRLIDGTSSQGFTNGDTIMWEGSYITDVV